MTKTVTAAWMMRLVEAGTVSLDDPLSRWVPEVPNAKKITLEQLARHTSGIPGDLDSDLFDSKPDAEIQKYKDSPKLASKPGTSFSYSRIGYILLGLALERASSQTWTDAVSEMARSAGATVSFDDAGFPDREVTDPDHHGYRGGLWASGGLVSSSKDAVKLLQWIFTKGLSPASVDAMTRFSPDPERWYYGLGLVPLCPCERQGDVLSADRFGLDSATGSFAVDRNGAVVLIRANAWFYDEQPVTAFYDLQSRMLDLTRPG